MSHRLFFRCAVAAGCALIAIACSGSVSTVGNHQTADAATYPTPEEAGSVDDPSPLDASIDALVFDAAHDGAESGVVDLPAPACHNVPQLADELTSTADPAPPPAPIPIAAIPLGRYVATQHVDYGGKTPLRPRSGRTTLVFTPNKEYYRYDDDNSHQVITLDWALTAGHLHRTVTCAGGATPPAPPLRVGAAPNGIVVYIDNYSGTGRTAVVTYERVP